MRGRLHGVAARADGKGWHGNIREIGGSIPLGEFAARAHLAPPLHRDVNIPVDFGEGTFHRIGPLVERHAKDVIRVERPRQQIFVARVHKFAGGFEASDLREGPSGPWPA